MQIDVFDNDESPYKGPPTEKNVPHYANNNENVVYFSYYGCDQE